MNDVMNLSLKQMHQWLPGSRLVGDPEQTVFRVHTDSRSVKPGDLFMALRGERFDAHDFLPQLNALGVKVAIAEKGLAQAGLMGLELDNTQQALGALAHAWRMQFNMPVIAVTGSNGKTTVTQMLASIMQAWQGAHALATQGNFNNEIGLPLTLLRMRAHHRVAVLELGMNHPGEIARLAIWAAPTVALVNNAQREHQEFMQSVQAVAEENGAVFKALPADGVAVFPASDQHQSVWRQFAAHLRVMDFGLPDSAVYVSQATWTNAQWQLRMQTPVGELNTTLNVAGQHNVHNAMAACACAVAVGVPLSLIAQGLAQFQAVNGRSRSLAMTWAGHAITLIDDSYNANPDSVRSAIELLAHAHGPRLLVLGDMGEVGDQGPVFHAEVGRYAQALGIDKVFTLGELSVHTAQACQGAQHFTDMESLTKAIKQVLPQMGTVLVKGSRFMRMERVVQALQSEQENQAAQLPHKEATCC